ncbi:hypothetical protein G7K_6590-t1 [Saitoella complicata NRRL Y-17804]|uniref:Vacuolar membrane protein n=1 Tax=Saitoella complicata (strain BCRC 22490 / CBS 7301 / JCM 7358 / NBRC 10748 / NRRL Y-17804) TaxID=698492 RepID=A0A0E9NS87_SAICN|nr:hypothetical protein G7K_6590-t1 [Saitoella complicata NRRL Y-17804]
MPTPFAPPTCNLVGPFALLIQCLLAFLAFLALLLKRQREPRRSRRPLRIWMFDVGKQAFGAGVVHGVNLGVSILGVGGFEEGAGGGGGGGGGGEDDGDPCVWYFFNVAVDTTIGVPILYVILTALTSFTVYLGIHGTISGQYSPPSTTSTTTKRKSRWSWWFKQTALYALSLLLMKVLIFVVFATLPGLVEALEELGEVLLRWTRGYPRVEEGFVLFVFPLVMNVLQAWLIDNIVKSKDVEGDEDADSESESTLVRPRRHGYRSYQSIRVVEDNDEDSSLDRPIKGAKEDGDEDTDDNVYDTAAGQRKIKISAVRRGSSGLRSEIPDGTIRRGSLERL